MSVTILNSNALSLPLADDSVDLVVTSPPYFGLRSYQDAGEHYEGQIGDEATPTEFVDALIAATREMVRVVKSSGSIWVNLGDKYSASPSGPQGGTGVVGDYADRIGGRRRLSHNVPTKSLIGIPWRYAIRCIDDLGLILRAEVIWSKPNGLPESVTDRVRRSHETWFHFTLQPRYFSGVDEIREGYSPNTSPTPRLFGGKSSGLGVRHAGAGTYDGTVNPLGKLPGSVWEIATQPLTVPDSLGIDHFAAFPMEWPRRIIKGWSPEGICVECGEGRRAVSDVDRVRLTGNFGHTADTPGRGKDGRAGKRIRTDVTITGYACGCPEPTADTRPAVVLDPFGGTGTTALVADALGRHGISNDLSADYCRLATWRTTDPAQRARAAQRPKPTETPVHPEQGVLL